MSRGPAAGWRDAIGQVPGRHPQVELRLEVLPAIGGRGRPVVPREAVVRLALIRTTGPRDTGLADAALTDLCVTANEYRVILTLTPHPAETGVGRARLTAWYESHGFGPRRRDDHEITDLMVRRPK